MAVELIDFGLSKPAVTKPFNQSGTYEWDCILKILGWQWSTDSIFSDLFSMGMIFIVALGYGDDLFFNVMCPHNLEKDLAKAIDWIHLDVNPVFWDDKSIDKLERDRETTRRILSAFYRFVVLTFKKPEELETVKMRGPKGEEVEVKELTALDELFKHTAIVELLAIQEKLGNNAKFAEDVEKFSLAYGTKMRVVRESPLFKTEGDAVMALKRMIHPRPHCRMLQEHFMQLLRSVSELRQHFKGQG